MARSPESTKTSLRQRLAARARDRWPQLAGITVRYHGDYEKSVLPSGYPAGTPQEALDCACGLYLGDTTAWLDAPPDELTGATTNRTAGSRCQSGRRRHRTVRCCWARRWRSTARRW